MRCSLARVKVGIERNLTFDQMKNRLDFSLFVPLGAAWVNGQLHSALFGDLDSLLLGAGTFLTVAQ